MLDQIAKRVPRTIEISIETQLATCAKLRWIPFERFYRAEKSRTRASFGSRVRSSVFCLARCVRYTGSDKVPPSALIKRAMEMTATRWDFEPRFDPTTGITDQYLPGTGTAEIPR
ncbi:MAG: hypothetical protein L0Y55_06275 [Anaerolineales bacterium]|nr:hypothetical protein [Anaerolineales bacterium]